MLSLVLAALVGSSTAVPSISMSPFSSSVNVLATYNSTCGNPSTLTASCDNSSDSDSFAASNSCCLESPSGLIQQVQFWDTDPSTGPSDSWTIHGLWPNHCDGTYTENCDSSRDYSDITSLLQDQGASDTLNYMQTYWVSNDESSEKFWEHEWSTHGTCYSTFNPSCLPADSPQGADAVAFFQTTVNLFKSLPTYTWLEKAGITPDDDKTYTLDELTSALKSASGVSRTCVESRGMRADGRLFLFCFAMQVTPSLDCRSGAVSEIYWWFHLKGSAIDGQFVPVDALQAGSCKSSGIKYPPKTSGDDGSDSDSDF
ncbi:ribonuclease T2-like protein [Amylocystis lapponica]|nr:ribonuclease T2-like protein [Amylocystis lapponica]